MKLFIVKRKYCVINRLMVKAEDKNEAETIVRFGEWDRQIGKIASETYITFESEEDIPPGQEKFQKCVDEKK